MTISSSKKYSSGNSPLMIIIVVVILAAIATLAYLFWGKSFMQKGVTPSMSPTPTAGAMSTAIPSANPTPTTTPTPTAKPVTKSITVGSTASIDGFESSSGGGNTGADIRAGRNSNLITRGFVSFAVPSELSGKTVDKATMRLYQGQIIGDPYAAGGSLKVDHLDYGSSLENADYSAPSLSSSFATLTTNGALEYKDVDVKDKLINDMANGRTYSQYRIHFATETVGGNVTGDFTYFESQDNSLGTSNFPQLVITYH